jgi:hypothetical protein
MAMVAKKFNFFFGELGPFLVESSLFPGEVALFPREHFLLVVKVSFFWGTFFCALKKLILRSTRHMVILEEQLKPLSPLRTCLFARATQALAPLETWLSPKEQLKPISP